MWCHKTTVVERQKRDSSPLLSLKGGQIFFPKLGDAVRQNPFFFQALFTVLLISSLTVFPTRELVTYCVSTINRACYDAKQNYL